MKTVSLLLGLTLLASSAHAANSCVDLYQGFVDTLPEMTMFGKFSRAISGTDDKEGDEMLGAVTTTFEWSTATQGLYINGANIAPPLVAARLGTTTYQAIEARDQMNSKSLIQEAQEGDGPHLEELFKKAKSNAKLASVTLEQVARTVLDLNERRAYCPYNKVISYSEMQGLVLTTLEQNQ